MGGISWRETKGREGFLPFLSSIQSAPRRDTAADTPLGHKRGGGRPPSDFPPLAPSLSRPTYLLKVTVMYSEEEREEEKEERKDLRWVGRQRRGVCKIGWAGILPRGGSEGVVDLGKRDGLVKWNSFCSLGMLVCALAQVKGVREIGMEAPPPL